MYLLTKAIIAIVCLLLCWQVCFAENKTETKISTDAKDMASSDETLNLLLKKLTDKDKEVRADAASGIMPGNEPRHSL